MIHARPDYAAIQPWPTHRPHLVKDELGNVFEVKNPHDRAVDEAIERGTIRPLIPDDEPVFLIRGQDVAAIPTALAYIDHATAAGAAPELIQCVRDHVARVEAWQAAGHVKIPDLPASVPDRPRPSATADPSDPAGPGAVAPPEA